MSEQHSTSTRESSTTIDLDEIASRTGVPRGDVVHVVLALVNDGAVDVGDWEAACTLLVERAAGDECIDLDSTPDAAEREGADA